MIKLIASLTCLALFSPMAAQADEKESTGIKEKRIVIEMEGDVDTKSIAEIMDMVEAEMGDETDVNVFVTIDDEGNVNIKKSDMPLHKTGNRLHKRIKMHMMGDRPMGRHASGRHMMAMMTDLATPMSEGAANCVVKNLSKVSSDAGAHILREACQTLHPAGEE
ncbi:MAG: hypothetical protein IIA75_04075 [Proteobacteria bacterium]|nr:hypothetical protein [Pseudomonadota bacterium]